MISDSLKCTCILEWCRHAFCWSAVYRLFRILLIRCFIVFILKCNFVHDRSKSYYTECLVSKRCDRCFSSRCFGDVLMKFLETLHSERCFSFVSSELSVTMSWRTFSACVLFFNLAVYVMVTFLLSYSCVGEWFACSSFHVKSESKVYSVCGIWISSLARHNSFWTEVQSD